MTDVRQFKQKMALFVALAVIVPLNADTVTVSIGEVEYDGYPTTVSVPVIVSNPSSSIGGIQFDLTDSHESVDLSSVSPAGNASAFNASYSEFSNGTNRILLYNGSGTSPLPVNSDTVLILLFDASSIASSVIDLAQTNLVVTDSAGTALPSIGEDGKIEIGNVVSFSMNSDSGDITDLVTLQISMDNDGDVGGFQFDLADNPDYLDLDSAWLDTRTADFSLSTSDISSGTRFIVYNSGNADISEGSGAVLNVRFKIDSLAYADDVEISFENTVASDDIGGSYWISSLNSGEVNVWPGYLDRPHSLTASSGEDAQVTLAWSLPGTGGGGGGTDELPIEQGFEDGEFGNWSTIQGPGTAGDATTGPNAFWHVSEDNPNNGTYNAQVDWGFGIDTWLITPSLDLTGETSVSLGFFWSSSYTWHVDPNDNGDMFVKVSTDGGTTWDDYLWTFGEIGEWQDFTWNETNLDLSAYAGESNVVVGFHVVADDNGAIYLDDVSINGGLSSVTEFGTTFSSNNSSSHAAVSKALPVAVSNPFFFSARNANQDLNGFNIYRSTLSPVDVSELNLVSSVAASMDTYVDTDLNNGIDYHYIVTADYGNMGESGPSNEATGTPVEWVEIGVEDGEALSGQTDTLELSINNDGGISSFGFVVTDAPDQLTAVEVLQTDRTNGWLLDVAENADGAFEVTGLSIGSLLGSGSGAVCKVVVSCFSLEVTTLNLTITSAEIVDANNNEMPWTADAGIFEIDVETQSLMLLNNYGDPGQSVSLSLIVNNTQNIHSLQFNIDDGGAGFVIGSSIEEADATSGWQISGSNVGGTYQVLLFDLSGQNGIAAGTTHLADIEFSVSSFAPTGSPVEIYISDVSMTDANSVEMYVEPYSAQIGVGVPEAIFSISDVETTAEGQVSGFSLSLANSATVGYFEVKVMDMPNALLALNVQPTDRMAGGSIGPGSGELETGETYIWGYFSSGGIAPGTGPIAEVDVYVDASTGMHGRSMLMFTHTAATNESQQVIFSLGMGSQNVHLSTENHESVIPEKFSLNQNYPNPFNPATVLSYDLPEASDVRLAVYDMMGRQVRVLVMGHESAGRKQVIWNGLDASGRAVSAGVYLYRIDTAQNSATRKMLLMK